MEWKFTGSRPVYQQIMELLRGAVLSGEFPPGSRVPSVRDLALSARVNPNTMQRALLELEREQLLITQGTLGRFVTDNPTIWHHMRQQAAQALIRESAARFRAMGLSMEQAAAMLLALEQEEQNG